jgi:hypothetical protein
MSRAMYEEYLVAMAMPYFIDLKQRLGNRAEALTNDLIKAKDWSDACRLQGKIEGINLALSMMVIRPEE